VRYARSVPREVATVSRFYGSLTGQAKTEATRRGSANTGVQSHVRGWNTGLRAAAHAASDNDADTFNVVITGGSMGNAVPMGLAEIEERPDGCVMVRIDERFGGGSYLVDSMGKVIGAVGV